MQKNTEAGNSLNVVEREPVPTQVLNPKACGVQGRSSDGGWGGTKIPAREKTLLFLRNFKKKINFSNLYERSGTGWIERKTKFMIFPIFIFWVIVIFWSLLWRHHPNFRWNFAMTRKIKIEEFFYYFSHSIQHIPHLPWSCDPNEGGGEVCTSLNGKKPNIFKA